MSASTRPAGLHSQNARICLRAGRASCTTCGVRVGARNPQVGLGLQHMSCFPPSAFTHSLDPTVNRALYFTWVDKLAGKRAAGACAWPSLWVKC